MAHFDHRWRPKRLLTRDELSLGNRTPRQATKTALGRERLEALLADYSQKSGSGRNAFEPDIVALKQKLGLS